MPDPQGGKFALGPRTFLTVREFLWHNCSAVCGLSAWQLFGGVNGDLLQEGLYHRQCDPGSCTQCPGPCRRPLLTSTSTGGSNTGLATHKVLFEPSQSLWQVWDLILNASLPLLPSCWGLLLCPWRSLAWASLIAQLIKNLPAMQETLVRFLGWEDPLEKG